jgi:hypothetical protein
MDRPLVTVIEIDLGSAETIPDQFHWVQVLCFLHGLMTFS